MVRDHGSGAPGPVAGVMHRIKNWWRRWFDGESARPQADRTQTTTSVVASGLRKLDDVLTSYERDLDEGGARSGADSPSSDQRSEEALPAGAPAADQPAHEETRWGDLTLRRKLGEGGFGEVWVAHDDNLDRDVALKLRKVERREEEALRAFLDEARRLARVRHPNVLVVHGVAVRNRRVGIWMDLIDGRTIEEVVDELGPLGPGEVVSIGRDLCRALAAVHEAGLLHGDLKPGNVMREKGGRIVLMDFGACLEFQSSADTEDQLLCYGTAVNAAPEVLEGERAEVAADIYSLGVLLFYMLTGRYPVEGESVEEVRGQHLRRDRQSLTDLRPELPSGLVHLVERALTPDPAQRFASVGAVESALNDVWEGGNPQSSQGRIRRALTLAAVSVAVVLAGTALWRSTVDGWVGGVDVGPGVAAVADEMVAVAPLTTGGDQESELLALAVSDYLTSRLREAGLPVLASKEVQRLSASPDPEAIHEATGAGRVIVGGVTPNSKGGSDVNMSVHVFAADGRSQFEDLAAQRIALPLVPNDFAYFHIARQALAEDVVLALAPDAELPGVGDAQTTAPDAYRLALSADRLLRSSLCDDSEDLESRLQQALRQDPQSAYYWWLLGNHYFTRVWGCGDPIALLDKAFAAASRADQLAPEGDSAQAQLRHTYLLESSRAEDSYALALAHEGSGPDGAFRVATTLRYAGFLDEAAKYLRQILAEDPIYFYRGNYGRAPNTLLYAGDLDRFLEQIPETGPYHSYYAGYVRMLQGEDDEARRILIEAFEAFPSDMFSSLSRALVAILNEQPGLASVTVRQLAASRSRLPLKDGEVTYKQAQLLTLAGDPQAALDNLGDAVDQGFFCVVCIELDPVLSRLADQSRFAPIVDVARRRHLAFAERFQLEPQLP